MPGMSIAYQVRRTGRRSKNISVRVHHDGTVRVGAPTWASLKDINRVVHMHADWIAEQVAQARALAPRYDEGSLQFYLGKRYPLAFELPERRDAVAFTGRRIVVATDARTPDRVRDLLRRWYRQEAAEVLAERIALVADLPWLKDVPNWRLRRMRSQWGSCTATADVTLNTQLIKASLDLVDYVILHEFAHIKHHDHGRGFERLMDRYMPDWRMRRRDLNALGPAILVD
jgi:predicted metal-dependent hydrolase